MRMDKTRRRSAIPQIDGGPFIVHCDGDNGDKLQIGIYKSAKKIINSKMKTQAILELRAFVLGSRNRCLPTEITATRSAKFAFYYYKYLHGATNRLRQKRIHDANKHETNNQSRIFCRRRKIKAQRATRTAQYRSERII